MDILLALLIFVLFCLVLRQSGQIKSQKWLTETFSKEITNLKKEIENLKSVLQPRPEKQDTKQEEAKVADPFPGLEKPPAVVHQEPLRTKPEPQIPERVPEARPVVPPAAVKPVAKSGFFGSDINWENFLGAKMFAWIGGLSLFIGFAFLLKYSFDRNLISPAVRVVLGFLCGAGLVGGGMHLKRKTYEVTAQTLCATGIVILYASSFAANSIYHFFGSTVTFALMTFITAGAFVLAAGANSKVIAILGIVGGFLTPPLLSTGQDQPFSLFSYITFLNVGLFCVAFYRKWNFLVALGAFGTVLTQLGWSMEFFRPEKVSIAMAVYLWFCVLYSVAFWYGNKIKRSDAWLAGSTVVLPFVTFLFTLCLVFNHDTGSRPGVIFTCLIGADLCLLATALVERKLQKFQLAAGGCVFLVLSLWITARMTPELLIWALAGSLVFALLHSTFPLIAARVTQSAGGSWHMHLFPLLALLLMLIPVVKGYGGKWLIWHFVLLFNGGILLLALFTTSALAILGALVVTGLVLIGWLFSGPAGAVDSVGLVILIGAFGILFSVVATFVLNRLRRKMPVTINEKSRGISDLFDISNSENLFFQIPALSTVLPFMLLIIASSRIEILNPASIFGLGFLLAGIAVWLVRFLKAPVLLLIAMGGYFLLEEVVHLGHFHPDNAPVFLGFYILTTALFFIFPFFYKKDYLETVLPWATAALSGPIHFFLIYDVVRKAYPNGVMGLLPAVMAVPFFFGLTTLIGWISKENRRRDSILAWFGGSTLFFITLIFPIQFDHQWLTIGWALEGTALIWFFHKVPHQGLKGLGVALLLGTFLRLGMNPAILLDYPLNSYPIFNWYLYTYGIAICCMMFAGRLLAPPRNRIMLFNVPPVLYSLGTILAFILMNIEIADLFSTGVSLKFQFSGDLARGMTYSIAWALFGLVLIIVGIRKQLRPVRLAAIGLIGVTLVKLFFFDLSRLDQLYRIGAFIGVAIVLIAASTLYQKWVVRRE